MDSNTNDPGPEIPPDVSPEQLEEALKWLEELASRPDMATEAGVTAMRADSSPFQGLIDSEGGDVPDWLHDAPPLPTDQSLADDSEYESRLDWLAKMTERESMEELPTLEWRRISDAAAQQATAEGAPPEEPILPLLPEGFDAAALEEAAESALLSEEPDTQPLPEGYLDERFPVAEAPEEPLVSEAVLHIPEALTDAPAAMPDEGELEAAVESPPPVEEVEAAPDLSAAAIDPETLLDTLPPDVELPPIDDLDAAMAWIEELAASQDAPIEDVPSVADRALASKLLREAGLSSESLDLRGTGNEMSLGDLSLLEGNTPVNAFVAAEDFADTIVLVETMAADQGRTLEEPVLPVPTEPQLPATSPAAAIPPADAVAGDDTFEDAMAFLDELAAAQEPLGSITQPIEPLELTAGEGVATADEMAAALVEGAADDEWAQPEWLTEPAAVDAEASPQDETQPAELVEPEEWAVETAAVATAAVATATAETAGPAVETQSEALSPEDAPWLEPVVDEEPLLPAEAEPAVELPAGMVAPAVMKSMNGNGEATLEETLLALDVLALPPGTSLADVDASLRQSGRAPARRDLPAAVEWLEIALGLSRPLPAAPLSDEDLIARMPEDPDAVLAWLEQMAEEDTVGSSPSLAAGEAAPAVAAPSVEAAAEPLSEELSEADLLAMPDDPDAIIAWLEGLAGGSPAARPEPAAPPVAVPAEESAAPEMAAEPSPVEAAPVLESAIEEVWPFDVGTTDVGTTDVGTTDVGTETDRAETPPVDETPVAVTVSEVTPVEVIIVETPAAEAAEAIADESMTVESATAESDTGRPPVAARPRRRGRRTKPAAEATAGELTLAEPAAVEAAAAEAADATAETVEAAADIVAQEQVTVADSAAEAAAVEAEEPPAPPARPASWVDLLKPLR